MTAGPAASAPAATRQAPGLRQTHTNDTAATGLVESVRLTQESDAIRPKSVRNVRHTQGIDHSPRSGRPRRRLCASYANRPASHRLGHRSRAGHCPARRPARRGFPKSGKIHRVTNINTSPNLANPRPPAQAFDVPLDAHLHTDLSPDSQVPLELYIAQAFERSIPEIAITDHLDFMPGAPAYEYADYGKREMIVRDAAERWAGKVTVRFGVELTYESRYDDTIRAYLATHSYDYVIGSVHAMSDGPYDRSRIASFAAGKSLAEAVAPYFAEVALAISSGLFDTIGHIDMCKRWLVPWFKASEYASIPEAYEPLLVALVETGVNLEVNASGLRHPTGETYPGPWVVRRFRELGGRRVTTGSDSHLPHTFAFGLEEACEILAAAGFDRLSLQRNMDRGDLVLPDRFHRTGGFVD
jgi:histidinol-phosphatase (PHP family)